MNPPLAAANPDIAIDELVRNDQLRLLFRQSLFAVFGSYLGSLVFAWLLWDMGDHRTIGLWLGLLGGATLLRLALFVAYFRTAEQLRVTRRWERRYWSTLLLSGAIWGVGALLVTPADNPLAQVITLFFVVGMTGGAVSAYSANRAMTLCAVALVLTPTFLSLLLQPQPLQLGLALATLLLAVSVVRATKEQSAALKMAFRLSHEMDLARRIASHAALTDGLTGVSNRRAFYERGEQLLNYCARNQRPLCAIVMDIDHFKQINDTHGHHAGDEVLRRIGELLQATFRKADACGRLGGEEFAILLADTGIDGAADIAEKLRGAIAGLEIALPEGSTKRITASLGVAAAGAAADLHALMSQADKAMYRAKAGGRNRVVAAGQVVAATAC